MKTFTDEGIRDLVASRFDPKELVKKALQRKKSMVSEDINYQR